MFCWLLCVLTFRLENVLSLHSLCLWFSRLLWAPALDFSLVTWSLLMSLSQLGFVEFVTWPHQCPPHFFPMIPHQHFYLTFSVPSKFWWICTPTSPCGIQWRLPQVLSRNVSVSQNRGVFWNAKVAPSFIVDISRIKYKSFLRVNNQSLSGKSTSKPVMI